MFNNHKSPETFDYKNIDALQRVMNSNILYITHEIDQIKKIVIQIVNAKNLQNQVDEFFEDSKREETVVE